jgi:DNA-directed RNA polymerase subunit M/transcription elongation factor TFIIS
MIEQEIEDKTANLYQEGLKLYKKLEYYNRFKAVLIDEDLYIPKIPNNIQFKTKIKQVQLKMFEKAVEFWGVDKVSMKTVGNNLQVINGQVLPPSDNPYSMHNTGSCQHTNGFQSYYIQVRMADEAMTRVKICNDCKRKIK